jgi:pyruvate ferredoxin oxidoreductase delta subunit
MLCYFYCPDASIIIEGGKAVGIDLKHCKGCGICATECPARVIVMKSEEKG